MPKRPKITESDKIVALRALRDRLNERLEGRGDSLAATTQGAYTIRSLFTASEVPIDKAVIVDVSVLRDALNVLIP